jgi:hypothetical protein
LLQQVYPGYAPNAHDVIPWGHSQVGHAALWTGQLLDAYTAATASPDEPKLQLSGVAAEAPGSNFIVQPDRQPDSDPATGQIDWLANARMPLTGVSTPIPVAPFFISCLVGTWAQFAASGTPDPNQCRRFLPS